MKWILYACFVANMIAGIIAASINDVNNKAFAFGFFFCAFCFIALAVFISNRERANTKDVS